MCFLKHSKKIVVTCPFYHWKSEKPSTFLQDEVTHFWNKMELYSIHSSWNTSFILTVHLTISTHMNSETAPGIHIVLTALFNSSNNTEILQVPLQSIKTYKNPYKNFTK